MKKSIGVMVILAGVLSAQATPIFTASFASNNVVLGIQGTDKGTAWVGYGNNAVATAAMDDGDYAPAMVSSGQWFGRDGQITLDGSSTTIALDTKGDWGRGNGLFVDLSGYDAGTYQVSFNVSALSLAGTSYANYFAYSFANPLDEGGVALDCGGKVAFETFRKKNAVDSTLTEVQAATGFTTTGTKNYSFTLDRAGVAGDAILLGWNVGTGSAASTGANAVSLTLTDVTISPAAIPEPATIGMLGLGALLTLMLRRARRP